jgi:RNA polymerase subunit RPABC4/transcription elongation factor Spt4
MFKKICSSCNNKIEHKFRFCPWCGVSLKKQKNEEDYGMLGIDDTIPEVINEDSSVIGGLLGPALNQLTKQLSKELQKLDMGKIENKGFQIKFSTRMPSGEMFQKKAGAEQKDSIREFPSKEEKERRMGLPIVSAESRLRRLPEGIIYEINIPGVESKQDISITRLENGLEIRAYSKDKCYIKTLPINVKVLKYTLRDNKLLLQINP